jgi:hypothetical protein
MTWGEGVFALVLLIFLVVRFYVLPDKKDFDAKRQDDTRPD